MSKLLNLILFINFLHAHSKHFGLKNFVAAQLSTPCPDIFQYHVESNEVKYGLLRIKCPEETNIQLNVEISVGNDVKGYNGDLELALSRAQTIDDILNRRPINYRLYFPMWINIPPKVTKIVLNGEIICTGPPIDIKTVRILTTINLKHTLKLNIPDGYTGTFQPDERFDSNPSNEPNPPFNPQKPVENPTFNPPKSPVYIESPTYHPSQPVQVPVFNPPQPPTYKPVNENPIYQPATPVEKFPIEPQISNIEFNPVPPKNPHKVFTHPPIITTPPSSSIHEKFSFTQILKSYGVNTDICGRSVNTNSLIANGEEVSKGEYPWLVAIFMIKSLGPEFLCGGNLISHKHVVTAAHCMKDSSRRVIHVDKIFLRFGAHNIHQWTQVSESKSVGAARISVHPDYQKMSSDADISVITLRDEIEFTKLIRPVCLWSEDFDLEAVVGRVGTVVGWGKDESNSLITPEPKKVSFPIVSQEDCLRSHYTFREITSNRTFCAGNRNGAGPCNGDSGGGFLIEQNDRWTLRGIVSMSIAKDNACDFSHYFVFCDIPKFMDWIINSLKPF